MNDKNLVLKMNLLGGMHEYICNVVQDEELQMDWLSLGVPDEPTEDDLKSIAENPIEFAEVVHLFGKIVWNDYK